MIDLEIFTTSTKRDMASSTEMFHTGNHFNILISKFYLINEQVLGNTNTYYEKSVEICNNTV